MSFTFFFSLPRACLPTTAVAAHVALVLIFSSAPAYAQDSLENPAQTSQNVLTPGVVGGFGKFFSGLSQSINNVVSGSADKPLILNVVPGVYQKSNEAIGEDRDINENRITRGILSLPGFTNYANTVLAKLKSASQVEQIPGQVIVVANDQMDAGATADGNIFISSGYIQEFKSEDQLAALLAHELAHVLLKHHDSNAFSRIQKQISTFTLTGMSIRNALDKSTGGAVSNALSPGQKDVIQQMELLIKVTDGALGPAWARRQESQADRLGMDLMIKAGYSYQDGFIPWLEAVAKWDAIQNQKKAETDKKQLAAMESMMATTKFEDSLKQGLKFALNDVREQLSASHDGGENRLNDIDAYFIKVYNEKVPQVAPTINPLEQARNRPDVKPVINAYSQVFQARSLLGEQKYVQAQAILKSLLTPKSPISSHALPNQLMFEAARGLGRKKEAEIYLLKSLQSDNSVWEVYDSAATYYKDNGNIAGIPKVGQEAFQRFSGAPSAYPKLIALYHRNGLTKEMNAALGECLFKQADKRDLCTAAAK